jgi:hypothetical protein
MGAFVRLKKFPIVGKRDVGETFLVKVFMEIPV